MAVVASVHGWFYPAACWLQALAECRTSERPECSTLSRRREQALKRRSLANWSAAERVTFHLDSFDESRRVSSYFDINLFFNNHTNKFTNSSFQLFSIQQVRSDETSSRRAGVRYIEIEPEMTISGHFPLMVGYFCEFVSIQADKPHDKSKHPRVQWCSLSYKFRYRYG